MAKVNYTKELMLEAVDNSKSIAGVCRYLGLQAVGGNYRTVKNKIEQYQIDTSHFTGQLWSKGESNTDRVSQFSLEELLQKNVNYKSANLKERLYTAGLKERKCECCGLDDDSIVYKLHHINGDHYDNRLENLQILCPNCHSKTPNFRNRNAKKETPKTLTEQRKKDRTCVCMNCGKEFQSDRADKHRKFCSIDCYRQYIQQEGHCLNTPIPGSVIDKEFLEQLCKECSSISEISEKIGRDRSTVRKYMKLYDLYDSFKLNH